MNIELEIKRAEGAELIGITHCSIPNSDYRKLLAIAEECKRLREVRWDKDRRVKIDELLEELEKK